MEGGESVLDTLFDEDVQDVEMLDVEEGELTEQFTKAELVESSDVGCNQVNQEPVQSNLRHKKKRKKNKRKRSSSSGPNVTDINRFVLDVCKRLRERKSYLVWTAAGCLGVSALSDLVKEIPEAEGFLRIIHVDAIQACGGQKTADGRRSRSGGGILWNIIRSRDPNAYKEIMRKGKEFEKQFKNQEPMQPTDDSSEKASLEINQVKCSPSDVSELPSNEQSQQMEQEPSAEQKRTSVHNRIRLPVTYDDDLLSGEHAKDEPTNRLDL